MESTRNLPKTSLFFRPALVCLTGALAILFQVWFLLVLFAWPSPVGIFFLFGIVFSLFFAWNRGYCHGLERGLTLNRKRPKTRKRNSSNPYRLKREIEERFPLVLALGIPGMVYFLSYRSGVREASREQRILSAFASHPRSKGSTLGEELETLYRLFRRGALTEEEFARAKEKILHPDRT